jgi:hypothetical protein
MTNLHWNNRRAGWFIARVRWSERKPAQSPPYPAEKARGGEIILRRPWQRIVFILGLALPVLLLLFIILLR